MQPEYPNQPLQPQPVAASQMKRHINALLIPLILAVLFLIGALTFGFWAFTERQDYKNNVDQKVAVASAEAVEAAEKAKEAEFAEREKKPLTDYKGPGAFGSVVVKYPKTWSAFVEEEADNSTPVNGYFHPNFVPGIDSGNAFALHLEVIEDDYDEVLDGFSRAAENGEVKITAIKAKKVPSVTGARIDGQIDRDKRGSVVLFPLRDKTLRLTAESEKYINDFNKIILGNLTFTP